MIKKRYIKITLVAALLFCTFTVAYFKSGLFSIRSYSSSLISLVPADLSGSQAAEEKDIADEGASDYFSIFRFISGLIPDQKKN